MSKAGKHIKQPTGNAAAKPFGTDAGSVANKYKWMPAKKATVPSNPKESHSNKP
jgi:hypothetical protein